MTRTFPPIPPSLRLDTVCHPAGKPTPVRLLLLLHARRDNKRHMQSTCPMHRLLTHAPLQGSPCNSHKTLQHNREGHHSDTTSFVSFASRRQQNTTSAQKIRLPRLQDETQASLQLTTGFLCTSHNSTCRPGSRQMYIANCTVPDNYFCLGL